jgi:hypothetical protein
VRCLTLLVTSDLITSFKLAAVAAAAEAEAQYFVRRSALQIVYFTPAHFAVHGSVTQRPHLQLARHHSSWRSTVNSAIRVCLVTPYSTHRTPANHMHRHVDSAFPPRPSPAVKHHLATNIPLPLLRPRAIRYRLLATILFGAGVDQHWEKAEVWGFVVAFGNTGSLVGRFAD